MKYGIIGAGAMGIRYGSRIVAMSFCEPRS